MDDLQLTNPEECPNCAGDCTVPVSFNLLNHFLNAIWQDSHAVVACYLINHRFNLLYLTYVVLS
jgi:hypothetical protein